jgi:hypothetical protein
MQYVVWFYVSQVRLARVFPPLASDVMELLLRIRPDPSSIIDTDTTSTERQAFMQVERAGYALLTAVVAMT